MRLPVTQCSGNDKNFVGVIIIAPIIEWEDLGFLSDGRRRDGDEEQVWLHEGVGGIMRVALAGWKGKIGVKTLTNR